MSRFCAFSRGTVDGLCGDTSLFCPHPLLILKMLRAQVWLLQLLLAECGVIRPWGGKRLLSLPVDTSGAPGPRP